MVLKNGSTAQLTWGTALACALQGASPATPCHESQQCTQAVPAALGAQCLVSSTPLPMDTPSAADPHLGAPPGVEHGNMSTDPN